MTDQSTDEEIKKKKRRRRKKKAPVTEKIEQQNTVALSSIEEKEIKKEEKVTSGDNSEEKDHKDFPLDTTHIPAASTSSLGIPNIADYIASMKQKSGVASVSVDTSRLVAIDGTDLSTLPGVYAIVPHAKGDHKLVYLRSNASQDLWDDDKSRTKGSQYIKQGRVIYDVFVDFKRHPFLKSIDGEHIDVWIIDSPEDLEKQLDTIRKSEGGGIHFGIPVVIEQPVAVTTQEEDEDNTHTIHSDFVDDGHLETESNDATDIEEERSDETEGVSETIKEVAVQEDTTEETNEILDSDEGKISDVDKSLQDVGGLELEIPELHSNSEDYREESNIPELGTQEVDISEDPYFQQEEATVLEEEVADIGDISESVVVPEGETEIDIPEDIVVDDIADIQISLPEGEQDAVVGEVNEVILPDTDQGINNEQQQVQQNDDFWSNPHEDASESSYETDSTVGGSGDGSPIRDSNYGQNTIVGEVKIPENNDLSTVQQEIDIPSIQEGVKAITITNPIEPISDPIAVVDQGNTPVPVIDISSIVLEPELILETDTKSTPDGVLDTFKDGVDSVFHTHFHHEDIINTPLQELKSSPGETQQEQEKISNPVLTAGVVSDTSIQQLAALSSSTNSSAAGGGSNKINATKNSKRILLIMAEILLPLLLLGLAYGLYKLMFSATEIDNPIDNQAPIKSEGLTTPVADSGTQIIPSQEQQQQQTGSIPKEVSVPDSVEGSQYTQDELGSLLRQYIKETDSLLAQSQYISNTESLKLLKIAQQKSSFMLNKIQSLDSNLSLEEIEQALKRIELYIKNAKELVVPN